MILATPSLAAAVPGQAVTVASRSCSGITLSHTTEWQFFLLHKIRASFQECHDFIGTPVSLKYVYTPSITFPSTVPAPGEEITLVSAPRLYYHSPREYIHRFSVRQRVVHIPTGSTFDIELRVYNEQGGHAAGQSVYARQGTAGAARWTTTSSFSAGAE
jgi:hypothetical protein